MTGTEHVDVARTQPRGVSRRTLLKTGAHAAWVIPAVQVVAAAPAFATCTSNCPPPQARVTVDISSAHWGQANKPAVAQAGNYVWVTLTIENTGAVATQGLTLTFTFSDNFTEIHQQGTDVPSGWNFDKHSAGADHPPVVYTSTLQLAAGASRTSTFMFQDTQFNGSGKRPAGSVTSAVTTTNGANVSDTQTVSAIS